MNFIGVNNTNYGNLIFGSGSATGINTDSIIFQRDFIPTDLPYLLSWYSSDYGVYSSTGVLAVNGEKVIQWKNKINNDINLNQDIVTMRPNYINGAINFTGHAMTGLNPVALNYPLNYYVVASGLSGYGASQAIVIKQGSGVNQSSSNKYGLTVNNVQRIGIRNGSTSSAINIYMKKQKDVLYVNFTGSNSTIIGTTTVDGIITTSLLSNDQKEFTVGAFTASSIVSTSFPITGNIYEILIYTGMAHSKNESSKIIKYLKEKWEIN